jgi:hypothetical protein
MLLTAKIRNIVGEEEIRDVEVVGGGTKGS